MPLTTPRRALRRAAALAGAAALITGLAAAPAMAADGPVDLSVSVPAQPRDGKAPVVTLPLDGAAKDLRVEVRNAVGAAQTASGVSLSFKLPAANDAGSVTLTDEGAARCQVGADGAGTCSLSDLAPGSVANLRLFRVTSTVADADATRRIGKVQLSVTSAEADADTSDNSFGLVVTVGKRTGLDLATWVREKDLVVKPGETGVLDGDDYTITNDSATPGRGIYWSILLPQRMHLTDVPKGCEKGSFDDGSRTWEGVECRLKDQKIAGNSTFTPPAMTYTIDAGAPARGKLDGNVQVAAVALHADNPRQEAAFTEQVVALSVPGVSDAQVGKYLNETQKTMWDNSAEFAVFTREDTVDLAVTAATPDTTVGGQTTAKVTVTNNGPWAIDESYTVWFTAPTGTTVLKAPDGCESEGSTYKCVITGKFDKGATRDLEFTLRADVQAIGADGVVKVTSGQPDAVAANNTAAVTFAVTAGPTQSPTPSPTDGGGLPTTGAGLTVLGVAAAALLTTGAVFVITARRRRARATGGEY